MLVLLPIAAFNKRLGGASEQNSLGDQSSTWICGYKWQTYHISPPCSVANHLYVRMENDQRFQPLPPSYTYKPTSFFAKRT